MCIACIISLMSPINRLRLILCIVFVASQVGSQPVGEAASAPLITIHSPGDGSLVTAPILLAADLQPGEDGLARVTLLTRENILLARQLIYLKDKSAEDNEFITHLNFEIPTASTEALLILETQDAFHRPLSLRSVLLTLQSEGEAAVHPNKPPKDWLTILSPQPNADFSGGELLVSGTVSPLTESPLLFELITENGGVIGSSQLAVAGKGSPFDFEFEMTYAFISSERDVRFVVRQSVDPYGTTVILDSLPLILAP